MADRNSSFSIDEFLSGYKPEEPEEESQSLDIDDFLSRYKSDADSPAEPDLSAGEPTLSTDSRLDTLAALDARDVGGRKVSEPAQESTGLFQSLPKGVLRGAATTAASVPKQAALDLYAPPPSVFANLGRIDRDEAIAPTDQGVWDPQARVRPPDPYATLYERYRKADPDGRWQMREELTDKIREATKSKIYQAGADLDKWVSENYQVSEENQERFLYKLSEAVGSAVTFVAAAGASRLALGKNLLSTFGAPGKLGSMMNASGQFEDAINSGADLGTALQAADLMSYAGYSEAVPIGNLFNRLDRVSGGQVKKWMFRAAQQGTEEAIQEAGIGIIQAAIANGMYDPERGIITMDRAEEGAIGFSTGALLETLFTLAMPSRRRGGAGGDIGSAGDGPIVTREELQNDVDERIAELNVKADQSELSEQERQELDFLRANRDQPATIGKVYNLRVEPTFDERVQEEMGKLTPEDRESPIPDELIAEGRASTAEAQASQQKPDQGTTDANEILQDEAQAGPAAGAETDLTGGATAGAETDLTGQAAETDLTGDAAAEPGRADESEEGVLAPIWTTGARNGDGAKQVTPIERVDMERNGVRFKGYRFREGQSTTYVDDEFVFDTKEEAELAHLENKVKKDRVAALERQKQAVIDAEKAGDTARAEEIRGKLPETEAWVAEVDEQIEKLRGQIEGRKTESQQAEEVADVPQKDTAEAQYEAYKKWIEDNTPETLNDSGGMMDSINFDERLTDQQIGDLLSMFNDKANQAGKPGAAMDPEAAEEYAPEPTAEELNEREEEEVYYETLEQDDGKISVWWDGELIGVADTEEEANAIIERDIAGEAPEGAGAEVNVSEALSKSTTTMPLSELKALNDPNVPIDKLRSNERAYLDNLKEQILRDGLKEPLEIRSTEGSEAGQFQDEVIWEGNHRLAVLEELGVEDVPVRYGAAPEGAAQGDTAEPAEAQNLSPQSTAAEREAFVQWYRQNQPGYDVWEAAEARVGKPEDVDVKEFAAGSKGSVLGRTNVYRTGDTWGYRNTYDVQGVMGGSDAVGGLTRQFATQAEALQAGLEQLSATFNPDHRSSLSDAKRRAMATIKQKIDAALAESGKSAFDPPTAEPQGSGALYIEEFSEKAIIVRGQTKENIERIKGAVPGVRALWNRRGKGWVFSKKREPEVRAALADLLGEAPAATDQDGSIPEEIKAKETGALITTLNESQFSATSVENNPDYYSAHIAELESRRGKLGRSLGAKADQAIDSGKRMLAEHAPATSGLTGATGTVKVDDALYWYAIKNEVKTDKGSAYDLTVTLPDGNEVTTTLNAGEKIRDLITKSILPQYQGESAEPQQPTVEEALDEAHEKEVAEAKTKVFESVQPGILGGGRRVKNIAALPEDQQHDAISRAAVFYLKAERSQAKKANDKVRVDAIDSLLVDNKRLNDAEFGDDWIKSTQEAIAKEAEKRKSNRGKKSGSTGESLRRWFDRRRKSIEDTAGLEDLHDLLKNLRKLTNRSELFNIADMIGDDATPGLERYLESVRHVLPTFPEMVKNEFVVFDRADPYDQLGNSLENTEDKRNDLRDMARHYADYMELVAKRLSGHKNIESAARAAEDLFQELHKEGEQYKEAARQRLIAIRAGQETDIPPAPNMQPTVVRHFLGYPGLSTYAWGKKEPSKYSKLGRLLREENEAKSDAGSRSTPIKRERKAVKDMQRNGFEDHRKGSDQDTGGLKAQFNFADITVGNYVTSEQEKVHVNGSFDAFADLATLLGWDFKDIGFGGSLHFAIGALGHGRHAAHYSPNQGAADGRGTVQVINVTKTSGDGTVAHEFGHAIDYNLRDTLEGRPSRVIDLIAHNLRFKAGADAFISKLEQDIDTFLEGGMWYPGMKKDPILSAQHHLRLQLRRARAKTVGDQSDYYRQALTGDANSKDAYWSNDRELFARAFEAYIYDKMKAAGQQNEYLVTSFVADGTISAPTHRFTPYPEGEERQEYNNLFDRFVSAISVENGKLSVNQAFVDSLEQDNENLVQRIQKMLDELDSRAAEKEAEAQAEEEEESSTLFVDEDINHLFGLDRPGPQGDQGSGRGESIDETLSTATEEELDDLMDDILAGVDEAAADQFHQNQVESETAAKSEDSQPAPAEPDYEPEAEEAEADKQAEPAEISEDAKARQESAEEIERLAKSGLKHGINFADNTLKGLAELFGGKNTLRSFPGGIDEETYQKAKPYFEAAYQDAVDSVKDLSAMMRAVVDYAGKGIVPYLRRWLQERRADIQNGDMQAIPTPRAPADEGAAGQAERNLDSDKIAAHFAKQFAAGKSYSSISEARREAGEVIGRKIEAGTSDAKIADEAIELGMLLRSQEIIDESRSEQATYSALVDLYEQMPRLGTRTSTSVAQQAYSTPVPLAYLAGKVSGITPEAKVYEPSAGNGILLLTADPANVTANELNEDRARALRTAFPGAVVTTNDASQWVPQGQFDVVIENPPFGVVKDANGETVRFQVDDRYQTNEIDHAIAMRSLEVMQDEGAAVLIVGSVAKTAKTEEARSDAYHSKSKREFYLSLYEAYNVVDHFTVSGSLYEKQGAGWPVDVIVIRGRGKSAMSLPAVSPPRTYSSWSELRELFDGRYQKPQIGARQAVSERDSGVQEPATPDGRDSSGGREARPDRQRGDDTQGQPGDVRGGSLDGEPSDTGSSQSDTGQSDPANRRERPAKRDRRASVGAKEGAKQVPYIPTSRKSTMDTLVPVNMQTAMQDALERLENRVINVDSFVAEELGYDESELSDYFAAEQIDAIALALDNMQKGAGFIIGDQTGIGKGRVVAAMIRYAIKSGRTPVFVTEKPNLYGDMYRDMIDVGMENMLGRDVSILMTNANEKVPLDEEGTVVLRTKATAVHNRLLRDQARTVVESGRLNGYDVIFTTYAQMQTHRGSSTPRQSFLNIVAEGGIVIFDESHNAGGSEAGRQSNSGEESAPNRAEFARNIAQKAHGVFYSSATYAKRPDVMDLYATTDMRLAVTDISKLAEAIQKGGIPMQQVVASMLAESGQYVRRERSFDGISYNSPTVKTDHVAYEDYSSALAEIQLFSSTIAKEAVRNLDQSLKASGRSVSGDGSTGGAGASSTNFTSVMHNLINQMLLSVKSERAVEKAIEALKNGEKPVITVSNTMGSYIADFAEQVNALPGDRLDISFNTMLERYLERTRRVTVKKPFMKKGEKAEHHYLTDAEIGPEGVVLFNQIRDHIRSMDLSGMPVSPIDHMRSRLVAAGYKVGEITGRSATLEYRNGEAYYKIRPGKERSITGRRSTISRFNDGRLDVVILNQAGSTGLSLHASEKFRDQRKRRMIIAQAEGNIDTHMQMLGRIHRTGQVVLPEYDQLVADIPAEKRPAAVLAKKMASLNANTTASRSSALTAEDVPDFMNQYGDEVAARLMQDLDDIHQKLGSPLSGSDGGLSPDDAIRKVTGRIPMLPLADQEMVYELLEAEYKSVLEQKEAAGESILEAKTLDLEAKVKNKRQVVAPRDESSPFAGGVFVEESTVNRLGRPHPTEKVISMVAESSDISTDGLSAENTAPLIAAGKKVTSGLFSGLWRDVTAYKKESLDAMEGDKSKKAFEKKVDEQVSKLRQGMTTAHIGATIKLSTSTGNFYGVVTRIQSSGKTKNPAALGSWRFTFAIADSAKQLTIPASQLFFGARHVAVVVEGTGVTTVEPAAEVMPGMPIYEAFDRLQSVSREDRTIVTGNMLAGFEHVNGKGAIVNFSDSQGGVRQGILMARGYDYGKEMDEYPVKFRTVDQVLTFLDRGNKVYDSSSSDPEKAIISIAPNGARTAVRISVARSKARGGRYYLAADVIKALGDGKEFVSAGDSMRVDVERHRARGVLEALQGAGATFAAHDSKDAARGIVGGENKQSDDESFSLADESDEWYYSELAEAAKNLKQEKGTPGQMMAMLKKQPGVKAREIEWTGLEEYLRGVGKTVTKKNLVEYLEANGVKVQTVTLREGGAGNLSNEQMQEMDEIFDDFPEYSFTLNDETGEYEFLWSGDTGGGLNREAPISYEELPAGLQHRLEGLEWSSSPGSTGRAKHAKLTLDGGENYREVLVALPEFTMDTEGFTVSRESGAGNREHVWVWGKDGEARGNKEVKKGLSDEIIIKQLTRRSPEARAAFNKNYVDEHYSEVPNVIMWVRLNDRAGPNGEKILFVEEIQGGWDKEGRRRGYRTPPDKVPPGFTIVNTTDEARKDGSLTVPDDAADLWQVHGNGYSSGVFESYEDALADAHKQEGNSSPVADNPFKGNAWVELAIKRVLRIAAEGNYDQVSWTTGNQQADRYNLAKYISKIRYKKNGENYYIEAYDHSGDTTLVRQAIEPEKIENVVGKDVAERILKGDGRNSKDPDRRGMKVLSGLDLEVGGEGMRSFYDKLVPKLLKKVTRKLDKDAKVGPTTLVKVEKFQPMRVQREPRVHEARQNIHADGKWYVVRNAEWGRTPYDTKAEAEATFPERKWGIEVNYEANRFEEGIRLGESADRWRFEYIYGRHDTKAEAEAKLAWMLDKQNKEGPGVWGIPVTAKMRESVFGGLPLFDKKGEQSQLAPGAKPRLEAALNDLQKRLKEVGISDKIALKLKDVIRDKDDYIVMNARGRYHRRVIEVATYARDKNWTLDHEIIHAMRDLGVIRDAEWRALTKAALADERLMASIRKRYAERSEEKQLEEAVADMHANWMRGDFRPTGFVKRAFERIRDFLQALGAALRGQGFNSPGEIFRRIDRGEVGRRGSSVRQEPAWATNESFAADRIGKDLPYAGTEYKGKRLYNYSSFVEWVHVDDLLDLQGNALGKTDIEELKKEIADEGGLREPVILFAGKNDRKASLGEGNHRVRAAKEMGYEYVPARVMVQRESGSGWSYPREDLTPVPNEYFSSDARPSAVFTSMRTKPLDVDNQPAAQARKASNESFAAAFHGSPHLFDRFSTDYIGTGEGAQARGWGMYFAQRPGVAKNYQLALSYGDIFLGEEIFDYDSKPKGDPARVAIDLMRFQYRGGEKVDFDALIAQLEATPDSLEFIEIEPGTEGQSKPKYWFKLPDGTEAALVASVRNKAPGWGGTEAEARESAWYGSIAWGAREGGVSTKEKIRERKAAALWLRNNRDKLRYGGHLYEVEIPDAIIEGMLDLDAPISKSNPALYARLKEELFADENIQRMTGDDLYARIVEGVGEEAANDGPDRESVMRKYDMPGDLAPGESVASQSRRLLKEYGHLMTPEDAAVMRRFFDRDSQYHASMYLYDEYGIPGLKFLDQQSRNPGINMGFIAGLANAIKTRNDTTQNYVLFDDSLITEVKRDGETVWDNPVDAELVAFAGKYDPGMGGKAAVLRDEESFSLSGEDFDPQRAREAMESISFDNEETEARWQDARKGVRGDGSATVARLREWWDSMTQGFSRHYIHLPEEGRFSDVREKLRKLEASPQASKEEALRLLKNIVGDMTPLELDVFTRKVVLEDLTFEVEQEHLLPFGLTPDDVQRELEKVNQALTPRLRDRAQFRNRLIRRVADEMVRSGVLSPDQARNPNYYRHQVLDYARTSYLMAKTPGQKLKAPYWARRMGSTLDINANLLEAEFEWMQRALTNVAEADAIEWIKRSEHNARDETVASAKAHNQRLVDQILASDMRDNGYTTGTGRQTSPLNDEWMGFKQRIAMGLGQIRKMLSDGYLEPPPRFELAAASMMSESVDAEIFPFLSWIIDNEQPGAMGAAMVFKAISQRKQWTKAMLGDKFADTIDMETLVKRGFAPENHVAWQPEEGHYLFMAKTIPEHVVERMMDHIADENAGPIEKAELRAALGSVKSLLAVGGPQYQLVLPEEVAATLNTLRPEYGESIIDAAFAKPLGLWKRWVLINPRRVIKYNLNNLSGDLDAVIAGNPKAVKQLPRAIKELYQVMIKGETPSARYREAVERGVFDSGLTVQEIPDINYLAEFEHLIDPPKIHKRPVAWTQAKLMKVWRALQRYTWFRENWLRYAAYLDYAERLESGEGMESLGYGAARREMVDALSDNKDRAALMARELVGDYGAISHFGSHIRRKLIPFFSWMEINTKRYWRLNINAWGQGVGKGFRTSAVTGAILGTRTTAYLYLRMMVMYGLVQAWNYLLMGDEMDELSAEEKVRLMIVLGRSDDGTIRMLRFQGALSDYLGWVGFEDAVGAASEVEKGRAGVSEVIEAILKAPVNRVVNGLTPLLSAPLESMTGKKYWPDVFEPRLIRDKWRNAASLFSFEHEYDLIFDRPSRGYLRSIEGVVTYQRDVGENSYNRVKGLTYDWLRREKGLTGSGGYVTPRSQALYEWRKAKRYGDEDAARKARRKLDDLGVTRKDLAASIKRAHPLGSVALKDRKKFKNTLTSEELKMLDDAIQWYKETYKN